MDFEKPRWKKSWGCRRAKGGLHPFRDRDWRLEAVLRRSSLKFGNCQRKSLSGIHVKLVNFPVCSTQPLRHKMKIKILAVLVAALITPLAGIAEVITLSDGTILEGSYVNGQEHGHWVFTFPDGMVMEGQYVNGQEHGHWVTTLSDGTVMEGPYVNGQKHGHWVLKAGNGMVEEGPMVNGLQHGHWVTTFPSGEVNEGPYVNGQKHGRWVLKDGNGMVEGLYVNGQIQ